METLRKITLPCADRAQRALSGDPNVNFPVRNILVQPHIASVTSNVLSRTGEFVNPAPAKQGLTPTQPMRERTMPASGKHETSRAPLRVNSGRSDKRFYASGLRPKQRRVR